MTCRSGKCAARVLFAKPLWPRLRIGCTWLICFVAVTGQAAYSQTIELARTLQSDAARATREHRPVIVLFSLPGCHFCDEIRQNYLLPLLRDAAPGHAPIISEIVITGTRTIIDFNGATVSQRSLAKHFGVHVAPTVLMLDAAGVPLAPPLVGGDTAGFYDAYLQQALATASKRMQSK